MSKFLVIDAEMEAHIDAISRDLHDPTDSKRVTNHVSAANIKRSIMVALEMLFAGDPSVTFETLPNGWAFRMIRKNEHGHTKFRIRVQREQF